MQHYAKHTTNTSSNFMKIEELPPDLRKAVIAHIPKAKHEGFDTEDGAIGWCLEASDAFLHTLEDHGVDIGTGEELLRHYIFKPLNKDEERLKEEDPFLKSFPLNPRSCCYHFAVKIGDIVIDWTARQFGAGNPFPAIWREYERQDNS